MPRAMRAVREAPTLPPVEFRLTHDNEKIPTPLDQRGLVDAKQLILDVNATIDPAFTWPAEFNDNHHLQWPKAYYGPVHSESAELQAFRNLPISRIMLPR